MKTNGVPFVADIQLSLNSVMAVHRHDWISRSGLQPPEI